jgi:HEAT repeat protein
MKRISCSVLAAAMLLSGTAVVRAAWPSETSAVQLKGGETPAQVQEAYTRAITALAPELGFGGNSTRSLQKYEATVHHAARPGAEAERLACAKAVAAALQGEASAEAKYWLLKLIEFAGKAELVPAEAGLLSSPEPLVREAARCALQHNPAPQAAEALRGALARAAEPAWQAALVLALGTRRDAASVPMIARLVEQKDEAVLSAALFALGNIATPEATRALAGAQKTVPESLRLTAAEAYLKGAEQLRKDGRASQAAAIYRELNQPAQPRAVRLAALQGTLQCAGVNAADMIPALLSGNDPDARALAAGFIPELNAAGLKKLAAGVDKLTPALQILVLGALADRGERSALPAALVTARSSEDAVRLAGLNALGRLGDASAVPLLVEAMQAGGERGAAAKGSLTRVDAGDVNDAVLTAMQKTADPGQRAELIGVLESRGAATAAPALVRELSAENENVRRAALRALGKLAGARELPPMLQALVKTAPGSEREDGEKAVAAVCSRGAEPEKQAAAVLAAYQGATASGQAALLPLLGRLGGKACFEQVKSALAGNDPALQKAAEAALMNWPDSDDAVENELLSLARRSQKDAERTAALRAYIRVIAMPSGLPAKTRLAKFQEAMNLATRDEERNYVLERVGEIKHIETVRFLVPRLDNPALAARAAGTLCDLARERDLRARNKAEFDQALNKIIEVCKDQAVIDRAKRRLQDK